jgi:hypothetical protein
MRQIKSMSEHELFALGLYRWSLTPTGEEAHNKSQAIGWKGRVYLNAYGSLTVQLLRDIYAGLVPR